MGTTALSVLGDAALAAISSPPVGKERVRPLVLWNKAKQTTVAHVNKYDQTRPRDRGHCEPPWHGGGRLRMRRPAMHRTGPSGTRTTNEN
jgi:hypothetical protein